jgi:hypothetical protein
MAMSYQGRHRDSLPERGSARRRALEGRRLVFSHTLHRPLASAAAMFVVAGASAAGYASAAKPQPSPESFTANPEAVAETHHSGAQRAYARTKQHKLAARARARRALDLARKVATERAARQQAREGILARARSDPRAVARVLLADKGWAGEQFGCLDRLWAKESGWSWKAGSPSSGAYGIPQSLPGSKMASVGGDWATNPVTQIKWGLKYISNSYGTPCAAWAHFKSTSSY